MTFEYGLTYPDGMSSNFTVPKVTQLEIKIVSDTVEIKFLAKDGPLKTITKSFTELTHLALSK